MNTELLQRWGWPGLAGALVLALGLGFVVARLTASAPESAPPAATTQRLPGEIKVEASYLAVVGIQTEAVTAGSIGADVLAPATVTPLPNGEAVVTAHAAGTVVRIVKQLGDPVRAGETLALVESREAAALAAERSVADAKAALARSNMSREKDLYDQRVSPKQELEKAQAELAVAEAEARRAREAAAAVHVAPDGKAAVVSPLTGKITAAAAALGTFVQPETELFRIADPNFVQVEAAVTAMDAQRLAVGDAAKVTTPSGMTVSATVRSVTPALNQQTRAATAVLSLGERHEPLTPGEIVQARITPKAAPLPGVVVPEEAVQSVDGRDVVFVRTAAGFKVQPVTVGARSAGRAAILSGLQAGQTIATRNAFLLKAELGKGQEEDE